MGQFRDMLIIESFDLTNDYKKLSKNEMDKYWLKITKSDDINDIEKFIYKKYKDMVCYITKHQGREYFIYTFYNKLMYEIHFLDMEHIAPDEESLDLKKTGNSQHVFSVIISIVVDTIKKRSIKMIKIRAPEHREDFYLKIIKKVLSKHNINPDIIIKQNEQQPGKDYIIKFNSIKMTPENMMGESILELEGPDLYDGRIENIIKLFKR